MDVRDAELQKSFGFTHWIFLGLLAGFRTVNFALENMVGAVAGRP